jgi:hypothetical protein
MLRQVAICVYDPARDARTLLPMRIAKPLLLVSTPIGVGFGLFEAYRLAGGLVLLMAAMVATLGTAMASVVSTIRRERAAEVQSRKQ